VLPKRINVPAVRKHIGTADPRMVEQSGKIYEELIGFVPPRIEARLSVTGVLDPELVELQEKARAHAMYPKSFDVKTAQLMLFGMLMMDGSDAAVLHAMAARRAGATWQELQDVISLCYLFRGLSAANKGAELIANLAAREEEARTGEQQ
jgi:alkylhydroperoxidase/carboxymuconolactone decarboxylase family protein YurZ